MTGNLEWLNGMASNGPWALVFGWLLWQVMKMYTEDRKASAAERESWRSAIIDFKVAVVDMTHVIERFADHAERESISSKRG